MNWDFCKKYRHGNLLLDLVERRGVFHGEDLVLAVPGPDNVATAEYIIKMAESAGIVTRGTWRPTKQQLFFGVGGLGSPNRHNMQHRSVVEFFWVPTYKNGI